MTLKTPSSLRAFGSHGRLPDVVVRHDHRHPGGRARVVPITSSAFTWFDENIAPSRRWWDGGLVVSRRELANEIAKLVAGRLSVTSVIERSDGAA